MHNVSHSARATARAATSIPTTNLIRVLCCVGAGLCVGLCAGYGDDAAAQASVYRCIAPDGTVEFRQRACRDAHTSRQIEIEDNHTGWVPPAGAQPGTAAAEKRTKKGQTSSSTDDKDKYADRCWSKEQQIERINAQLRAGYSAQQGVKLRRRRTEHEAFLSRYCR